MASSSSAPEIHHQSMASSSLEPPQSKILTLRSSDNDEFQVEESIAIQSGTIKNMVEDGYTDIPLMNINSEVLTKILNYLMKHAEKTGASEEELKEFDNEFAKMSFKKLSVFVFAANFLHISGLMSLLCQTIADKIKNKSVNAVRQIFNITSDYTPEEEAEVRAEHEWAHEGEFDDTIDDDDDTSEEEEKSVVCDEGESDDECTSKTLLNN
ncbi:SKP1-like protein 11 [Solanum dulcamara]|uniref:SKP1-like protein 11 n=1 Tax=Solanum dulcamara TaxID=45834 RepID=UPI002486280B|nr:SKP1-like protein 11 [Solanum dulcamara]